MQETESIILPKAVSLVAAVGFLILTLWFGERSYDPQHTCSHKDWEAQCGFVYLTLVWAAFAWFAMLLLSICFALSETNDRFVKITSNVLFTIASFFSIMAISALVAAPNEKHHDATRGLVIASVSIGSILTVVLAVLGFFNE